MGNYKYNPFTGTLDRSSTTTNTSTGNVVEYAMNFTNQSTVTVNHQLGDRYPDVTVTDTNGQEIYGDIIYVSTDTLTVIFNQLVTGAILCRA